MRRHIRILDIIYYFIRQFELWYPVKDIKRQNNQNTLTARSCNYIWSYISSLLLKRGLIPFAEIIRNFLCSVIPANVLWTKSKSKQRDYELYGLRIKQASAGHDNAPPRGQWEPFNLQTGRNCLCADTEKVWNRTRVDIECSYALQEHSPRAEDTNRWRAGRIERENVPVYALE